MSPMATSAQQVIVEWQEIAGRQSTGEEEREKAIALDSKCHVARKWSRKPAMKLHAVFLNLLPGLNRDVAPQSDACKRVRKRRPSIIATLLRLLLLPRLIVSHNSSTVQFAPPFFCFVCVPTTTPRCHATAFLLFTST